MGIVRENRKKGVIESIHLNGRHAQYRINIYNIMNWKLKLSIFVVYVYVSVDN